jgi:hypothetical protein
MRRELRLWIVSKPEANAQSEPWRTKSPESASFDEIYPPP